MASNQLLGPKVAALGMSEVIPPPPTHESISDIPEVWEEPVRRARRRSVRVASNSTSMPITNTPNVEQVTIARSAGHSARIEGGLDVADQFLLPTARFQVAVSDSITVGAHVAAIKNAFGNTGSAYGGGISGAYYFNHTPFRGLSADLGASLYHMEGTNKFRASTADPIVLSSTVGWNGAIADRITFSANGGLQYAHNRGRNIGDIKFNGLRPLVKLGVGYEF